MQKHDIPANSEGILTIRYRVSSNFRRENASNGFNVNLQQPPYSNGINDTGDDAVSSFTYVRAVDSGDAPASYGSAMHEIDVFKDAVTGDYRNYVFLGSKVDPDSTAIFSAEAEGDDNSEGDDEEGILFPDLIRGETALIPVIVTVHEPGYGSLNGWIDWNGDGDFIDAGEKITGRVTLFQSDTIQLKIPVPVDAITGRPTYARFRFGDNVAVPGKIPNGWGEAEDYRITILEKRN